MSTGPAAGGYHTSEDEKILHKLGYAQELFRGDGRVPELRDQLHDHLDPRRMSDLVLHRVQQGGPVAVTWGWLLVGLMSTIVALAMAEIASAYPDRRRPLLLGVEARKPGLGLVHRLVQPRSARSRSPRRSATASRRSRRSLLNYWFDYSRTRRNGTDLERSIFMLYAIILLAARPDQPAQRHHHGDPEHDLGLLAHGRRRR